MSARTIALVGAGPRGTVVFERLAASLDELWPTGELRIEIIDPHRPGPGRIWTREQPHELCMNTFADEVTLFTDDSTPTAGPRRVGPTLYQWCRLAISGEADEAIPDAVRRTFAEHPVDDAVGADALLIAEMREILPWSHPSRVLFGAYLAWCWDRVVALLPPRVSVVHRARCAVSVTRAADGYDIRLDEGGSVHAHAAVLSLGWLPSEPGAADRALAAEVEACGLRWIRSGSPREQDLDALVAGEPVLVRGLGMGFFDVMALVTVGRGGRFVPDGPARGRAPGARERLRYEPSGEEPLLLVGSRGGLPFRAKPRYAALPPVSAQRFLRAALAGDASIDVGADVLPHALRDATDAYYTTLAQTEPEAFAVPLVQMRRELATHDVREPRWRRYLETAIREPRHRFDVDTLVDPAGRFSSSTKDFHTWATSYLDHDLAEAARGADSPFKAAAWSLSSARGLLARAVTARRIDGRSLVGDYREFVAVGAQLGSGPPAFRGEQLLALVEAGIVRFVGPEMSVRVDRERSVFVAHSPRVDGSEHAASALVDAWMAGPEAAATTDPLLGSLVEQKLARVYRMPSIDGTSYLTRSLDTDAESSRLVDSDGDSAAGLFLLGIPADEVRGGSMHSPLPNTGSAFLVDSDITARAALRAAAAPCH